MIEYTHNMVLCFYGSMNILNSKGEQIMNLIEQIESEYLKKDIPEFKVGDTVKVFVKVVEGDKERLQAYEGIVIARRNGGVRESFTVRKISFGVGVERTFPINSPRIDHIEVTKRGKVRRAKLYYLRDLTGKSARVKEDIRARSNKD